MDHSSNRNVVFLQFSHAAVPLNYNKNNNGAPLALIAYRTEEDDNVAFLPPTTPAVHLDRIVTTTNNNNNNNINNDNNDVNETSLVLVAGKTEDMSFSIANNNDFPITHAVITLASQNSDLKNRRRFNMELTNHESPFQVWVLYQDIRFHLSNR